MTEVKKKTGHDGFKDCAICGAKLKYTESTLRRCAVCGEEKLSNAVCENGHFVCDACHALGAAGSAIALLKESRECDAITLFERAVAVKGVHLHGPEHHIIVPCVLLTAFRNAGGEIDLDSAIKEAYKRASQVPGGACGYWGVCGAAVGAGIYASILLGSSPLNEAAWRHPHRLAARCMERISAIGGVRCCKRVGRLCIEEAAAFTAEYTGVEIKTHRAGCVYRDKNAECIGESCPYFPHRTTHAAGCGPKRAP